METCCDPLNLEPFDPSTFSKTVGETYVMEGGKGALIQGCRVVRSEKWDENPSKSNQLSHVQPHPLLRCIGDWIGRKILLQKWRKSTFSRFRSGLIFDGIRYGTIWKIWIENYLLEKRWSTRFRELKLILREFKWIRDYNDNDFVYFNKLYH